MGKLRVFVSAGESRTGEGVIHELFSDQCKDQIESVHCSFPESVKYPELEKIGAKIHGMDLGKASVDDLSKMFKDQKIDVCISIAPATEKKTEICDKMCKAMKNAGVKNVILISSQGADETDKKHLKQFKDLEECAKKNCPDTNLVIVRSGHYMQNLYLYAKQMREQKMLGLPMEKGKIAMVDARDVSLASAKIATEGCDKHKNQVYTLTGPKSMSGDEMVKVMKDAGLGDISFKNISRSEAETYLRSLSSVDESEIQLLQEQFELVQMGKMDFVSGDFKKLVGKDPRSLETFMKESVQVFKHPMKVEG